MVNSWVNLFQVTIKLKTVKTQDTCIESCGTLLSYRHALWRHTHQKHSKTIDHTPPTWFTLKGWRRNLSKFWSWSTVQTSRWSVFRMVNNPFYRSTPPKNTGLGAATRAVDRSALHTLVEETAEMLGIPWGLFMGHNMGYNIGYMIWDKIGNIIIWDYNMLCISGYNTRDIIWIWDITNISATIWFIRLVVPRFVAKLLVTPLSNGLVYCTGAWNQWPFQDPIDWRYRFHI